MAFGWKKAALVALTTPLLLFSGVVATSTLQEYSTWKDHEYGVLEHIFALTSHGLEPVPSWRCIDPPTPMAASPIQITTFSTLDYELDTSAWPQGVAQRLPVAMQFKPLQPANDLQTAWEYAQLHPDQIVLVYTDQHYRGPRLNDKLEGFACGNVAVINIEIDCPESIVAHEVAHVLGLRHTPSGLMRARGVSCTDTLVDSQSQWLQHHYPSQDVSGLAFAEAGPRSH